MEKIISGIMIIVFMLSCAILNATMPKKEAETVIEPVSITYYDADYPLSQIEYEIVCKAVMSEAGSIKEPYEGKVALAQSIKNGCRKNGIRPQELLKEYNYAEWADNYTKEVERAVQAVFVDGENVFPEKFKDNVTIFYNPELIESEYHESQIYVCTIGGHRFFAEREI